MYADPDNDKETAPFQTHKLSDSLSALHFSSSNVFGGISGNWMCQGAVDLIWFEQIQF